MLFFILAGLVLLFGFSAFIGAPYLPSKKSDAERALSELYPLGEGDVLVDIGSGDGVVLRLAASKGARAVGYEINPVLVTVSKLLSRSSNNISTHWASFWRASLPVDTTVVYVFGDSRDIERMAAKVQETATELGRPLNFISYAIAVPSLEPKKKVGAHYLYELKPLQTDIA